MMSLNWHSMTQLTPFSAEQGTRGTQDLPDFSVERTPLTVVSSIILGVGGSGGRGKQQDCLVTLSSGIHNTAVGAAINGLKLEQFYTFAFINALQTMKTP